MSEMFGGSNGSSAVTRRRLSKDPNFISSSPSYGVRQGLIADSERRLPSGIQDLRADRRIPTSLSVRVGGEWQQIAGDVSAQGALLLMPEELASNRVELKVSLSGSEQTWEVVGNVLAAEDRPKRIAYHVRFDERVPAIAAEIEAQRNRS
jgi:hypothetical protein